MLIEENGVRGTSVSLSFIGKMFTTFQVLVTSIAKSVREGPDARGATSHPLLEGSRLNLVATSPGSFRVVVSSQIPALAIGDSLVKESLKQFNELLSCADDKDLIKHKIGDLGPTVILKYKNFLDVISKNDVDVKFYDKMRPTSFQTWRLSSELSSVANIFTVMYIPLLIMNSKNQCSTSMLMRLVDTSSASGFQLPEDMTKLFGDAVTSKSVSY